jgi:hypothetical protein
LGSDCVEKIDEHIGRGEEVKEKMRWRALGGEGFG